MNNETLELAARHLCMLRDVDPEQLVPVAPPAQNGIVPFVVHTKRLWELYVEEVAAQWVISEAIGQALAGSPVPSPVIAA